MTNMTNSMIVMLWPMLPCRNFGNSLFLGSARKHYNKAVVWGRTRVVYEGSKDFGVSCGELFVLGVLGTVST